MSAFLKIDLLRDFAACVYLSPRFLFVVVSNIVGSESGITAVYALHTTRSLPVTHCINTYPCTYSHREEEEGEPVRRLEGH
jgi:hypothetical protein